eukprot:3707524-Pleurochrysis_carterae.AAC.1
MPRALLGGTIGAGAPADSAGVCPPAACGAAGGADSGYHRRRGPGTESQVKSNPRTRAHPRFKYVVLSPVTSSKEVAEPPGGIDI